MLQVAYYDGPDATRQAGTLELDGGFVTVRWRYHERREPVAKVRISAAMAGAPRRLTFPDGAFCEVAKEAMLDEMLLRAGYRAPRVSRRQAIRTTLGISAALIVMLAIVGYAYGPSWLAHRAATMLRPDMKAALAVRTRFTLDSRYLKPTALSSERRAELIAGFNALRYPPEAPEMNVNVLFRSGPGLGADTLVLPDGTLVLLDELVQLGDHDEQLIALMAHELGHAHHGHSLETALRSDVWATLVYVLIRDVTRLFRKMPENTLRLRYPPAFEAEASLYATDLLEANGIAASRLADLRRKLEENRRGGWGFRHRA
jgi:Zn-dependent protease with chaperone function